MRPIWIVVAAAAAALAFMMTGVAAAQSTAHSNAVYLGEVNIVYQPQPSGYQPQGSEIDLSDQGKSFDVSCIIGAEGKLQNCQAGDNDLYDQNFVRIAVANVSQWVMSPQTVDGKSSVGRTLLVTCQFRRADRTDVATAESK